jgi:hypothetical protein
LGINNFSAPEKQVDIKDKTDTLSGQFMKNGTTTILNVVLGLFLALAVIFCLQTYFLSAEFRNLNGQISGVNTWRQAVQQLVVDCSEYSKKNPAIVPILETIGYKQPAK